MASKQLDQLYILGWVLTGIIFALLVFLIVNKIVEGRQDSGKQTAQEGPAFIHQICVGDRCETVGIDEMLKWEKMPAPGSSGKVCLGDRCWGVEFKRLRPGKEI